MASPYETPVPKRRAYGQASNGVDYPDLPAELFTPTRAYNTPSRDYGQEQQYRSSQQQQIAPPARSVQTEQQLVPRQTEKTDGLRPIERAAKVIGDALEAEKKYPQLDDIVSRKFAMNMSVRDWDIANGRCA